MNNPIIVNGFYPSEWYNIIDALEDYKLHLKDDWDEMTSAQKAWCKHEMAKTDDTLLHVQSILGHVNL